MFFNIVKDKQTDIELAKIRIITNARRRILFFKMNSIENKLNDYLVEKYNIKLKPLCIKLLNRIKITTDTKNNIIILFKTIDDDKIASFITYGNSEIQGSKILQFAFKDIK